VAAAVVTPPGPASLTETVATVKKTVNYDIEVIELDINTVFVDSNISMAIRSPQSREYDSLETRLGSPHLKPGTTTMFGQKL
jgi:hypothetical protein